MRKAHTFQVAASLILIAAIWVLAGRVYRAYERLSGEFSVPVPNQATAMAEQPLPEELNVATPTLEEFSAVIERPIFSPSRRPATLIAETPEAMAAPTLEVDLVGIVMWQSQRIALVRLKQDSRVIKVNQGADVAGWTAVAIEPSRVLFRRGDVEKEIRLMYNNNQIDG